MPRGAFIAVLSCTVLLPVEPAYAECRTTLPPAAERAGYWQYHTARGKRCWFGPLKVGARAHVVAKQQPVRATTGVEQSSKATVMRVLHVPPPHDDPEIWPKPAPPDDDPERLLEALDAIIVSLEHPPMRTIYEDVLIRGRLAHIRELCTDWLDDDEE
jgi:hypothetical protein